MTQKLNNDNGLQGLWTRTTGYNRRLAKKRVQWLIEHSASYQLLCWVDSLVLRNPPPSPSAKTLAVRLKRQDDEQPRDKFKMTKIEILPLDGIEIENIGKLSLGQSKSEIEIILGNASESSNLKQLYFEDYEFRIDLDKNGNTEFIEFIYGPFPEKTKISIYNVDPFQIGADKLVKILTEKNNGKIDDSEADFSFGFLNISVGIWRDATEKIIEESIAEMKADNEYEENKDWLNEDLEKAKNFWTIGIGVKNYYK